MKDSERCEMFGVCGMIIWNLDGMVGLLAIRMAIRKTSIVLFLNYWFFICVLHEHSKFHRNCFEDIGFLECFAVN